MSEFSLSQLLAILQDNIQRSYEHSETLAALDREGNAEKITMALDRVEVEIPIVARFSETMQVSSEVFAKLEGLTAYELANARVDLPTATPSLRRAVQDQIALVSARDIMRVEADAQSPTIVDQNKNKSMRDRLDDIDTDISSIRIEATKELSRASTIARNVLFDTSLDVGAGGITGKISVQFKAVLK